ncbi:NADH dehydrogenase [ubiquinone] iron-sulfur protein 6, mitochondrial-like [Liolophura sinensis]|uniref:NADH dehydrogenase [ubiquinone] iron-sulfur protein 6, mitochondrial-like n=1 Tax=Liolophura sinensis TaxID=3198878 RepID=UPI00315983CE
MAASMLLRTISRLPYSAASTRLFSSSSCVCQPGSNIYKPTHTGQVWEADDYRQARFVGKDKLVNERFAIDLIAEDPIVVVNGRHVWSNSGGALGHPKVYINLDKPEIGTCGYSGRKFIQKKYYNEAKHGPSITYEEYLAQMRE